MRELSGKVGRYEVYGHSASRNGGELYAAREAARSPSRSNLFALTLLPERDNHPRAIAHLRAALRRQTSFVNPGFAQHHDVFAHEGRLLVAHEFVRGEPLSRVLQNVDRAQAALFAVSITAHLARLLHAAHTYEDEHVEAGQVVHGDLCASTVMVTYEGSLVLVDSGLAAAQSLLVPDRSGLRGHLAHLAPERAASHPDVGPAADVWGLGLLLYEILVGAPALEARSEGELIAKAMRGDVPALGSRVRTSEALVRIVDRTLAPEPKLRISAAELADELAALRSGKLASWNLQEQLGKLMARHYSHRAQALRTLEERWGKRSLLEARSRARAEALRAGSGELLPRAGSGDLLLRPGTGDLPTRTGTGDLPTRTGTGDLPTRTGTGDLPRRGGTGDVVPRTGTGDLPRRGGTGDVVPRTASGALRDPVVRLGSLPRAQPPATVVDRPPAREAAFAGEIELVLEELPASALLAQPTPADPPPRTEDLAREGSRDLPRTRAPLSFVRGLLLCMLCVVVVTLSSAWWPAAWTEVAFAAGAAIVEALQTIGATLAGGGA